MKEKVENVLRLVISAKDGMSSIVWNDNSKIILFNIDIARKYAKPPVKDFEQEQQVSK